MNLDRLPRAVPDHLRQVRSVSSRQQTRQLENKLWIGRDFIFRGVNIEPRESKPSSPDVFLSAVPARPGRLGLLSRQHFGRRVF